MARLSCSSQRPAVSGFTLIELLLAITIFAVLGLAANTSLQQVMRADEQSREHSDQLAALQWAMGQIQQDFEQIAPFRPHRSENETAQPWVLRSGPGEEQSEQYGVTLLRAGWRNPAGMMPRSDLQVVKYHVSENSLYRSYYPFADVVSGSLPLEAPVLEQVELFELAFFDGSEWQERWQSLQAPQVIRLRLTLTQWGEIERLFLMPDGVQL